MRTADIRIEKGEVTAAELAAVTLLLLARSTPPPSPSTNRPKPTTPWRHDNYQAPHSWQG